MENLAGLFVVGNVLPAARLIRKMEIGVLENSFPLKERMKLRQKLLEEINEGIGEPANVRRPKHHVVVPLLLVHADRVLHSPIDP